MVYLTGDTHGTFGSLIAWANKMGLTMDDTIIVLGDHGINFHLSWKDKKTKDKIQKKLPCNLFLIRGNHDRRAIDVFTRPMSDWYNGDYPAVRGIMSDWFGASVLIEEKYPKIKHAIDGNIYTIEGKKCLVIGGGYSVDKWYRLENGWTWIQNEMLDENELAVIYDTFCNNKVDVILSHVAPLHLEPWMRHLWMSGVKGGWDGIDKSMERWMDKLYWNECNEIEMHYFGHNHANINCGPTGVMLYGCIVKFGEKAPPVYTEFNCREVL